MTQKVNGRVQQGFWDERTVVYMNIAGDFAYPAAVGDHSAWSIGGTIQRMMNILQTRGTIIAFNSIDATNASVIYGTSSGEFADDFDGTASVAFAEITAQLAAIEDIDPVTGVATPSPYVPTLFDGFRAAQVQV